MMGQWYSTFLLGSLRQANINSDDDDDSDSSSSYDHLPSNFLTNNEQSSQSGRRKRKRKRHQKSSSHDGDSPTTKKKLNTADYIYEHLFHNSEGSDVTVVALGHEWKLHKVYLCQAQFFNALFGGNWKETKNRKVRLDVSDSNITVKSLAVLFASLYRDEVVFDVDEAVSITAAASWLQLLLVFALKESVLERSGEFMAEHLTSSTIFPYYSAAVNYGLGQLEKASTTWLLFNLLHCAEIPDFLVQIKPSLMAQLILSNDLLTPQGEMEIYRVLKRWIFLRLNTQYEGQTGADTLNSTVNEYFVNDEDSALSSFYESANGAQYRAALDGVRVGNLVTSSKAITLLNDHVLPSKLVTDACSSQWKRLLNVEDTYTVSDDECFDITESHFNQSAVRCGRILHDDTPGVDVVLFRHFP